MADKAVTPADSTNADASAPKRAHYETPALVSYGTLFAETTKTPCSDLHADAGHTDFCDPDGGPVDGPK
jgi:hypothetical protein